MPEINNEAVDLVLPFLDRHHLSEVIDDILLIENYAIEENEHIFSKNQLKHNLIMSCLIAQKIIRDGNPTPKTLAKIQTSFTIEAFNSIRFNKKNLNNQPKLLQLPFLIARSYLTPQEVMWAKIAIYIAIVLRHHKLKSYYTRIIQRIKVACFYQTPLKTWILENLPSINVDINEKEQNSLVFTNFLQIETLIDYLSELEKSTTNTTRRNQATEVRLCLEVALNPKRRKKIDREIKKLEKRKKSKKKPVESKSFENFTDAKRDKSLKNA